MVNNINSNKVCLNYLMESVPSGAMNNTTTNNKIKAYCDCPTISLTPTKTQFPTATPTRTCTRTVTPTRTKTPTPTQTPTHTVTPSITRTITPTKSITPTLTRTITVTKTLTPTNSLTRTVTPTLTPTKTPTQTQTLGCSGPCRDVSNCNVTVTWKKHGYEYNLVDNEPFGWYFAPFTPNPNSSLANLTCAYIAYFQDQNFEDGGDFEIILNLNTNLSCNTTIVNFDQNRNVGDPDCLLSIESGDRACCCGCDDPVWLGIDPSYGCPEITVILNCSN